MPIRAAVDIGGMFTDVVTYDDASGELALRTTLSTPHDLIQRVSDGLGRRERPSTNRGSSSTAARSWSTRAMRECTGEEILLVSAVTGERELRRDVAEAVNICFHPVNTRRTGVDADAAVDSWLCVRGLHNLRVVDASLMPEITSGNTKAPTLVIAWQGGADLITSEGGR